MNIFRCCFSLCNSDGELCPRIDTPLHTAVKENELDQIKSLIANKADVGAKGTYGWTPLHHAAFGGHQLAACILLENRANVDKADDFKQTPLYQAACEKHSPVIEILLGHGADIHKRDSWGSTPAQIAPHYMKQMLLLKNLRLFISQEAQSSG